MLLNFLDGIQISMQIPSLKQMKCRKQGKLQKNLNATQDLGKERKGKI